MKSIEREKRKIRIRSLEWLYAKRGIILDLLMQFSWKLANDISSNKYASSPLVVMDPKPVDKCGVAGVFYTVSCALIYAPSMAARIERNSGCSRIWAIRGMKLLSKCSVFLAEKRVAASRRYCIQARGNTQRNILFDAQCRVSELPFVCMNLMKIWNKMFARTIHYLRQYYFPAFRAHQFCKISPVFPANGNGLMYKSECTPSRRGRRLPLVLQPTRTTYTFLLRV